MQRLCEMIDPSGSLRLASPVHITTLVEVLFLLERFSGKSQVGSTHYCCSQQHHHVECYRRCTADSRVQQRSDTDRPWADYRSGRLAVFYRWSPAIPRASLHSLAAEHAGWQGRRDIRRLSSLCHCANGHHDQCSQQGPWSNAVRVGRETSGRCCKGQSINCPAHLKPRTQHLTVADLLSLTGHIRSRPHLPSLHLDRQALRLLPLHPSG